MRVSRRSSRRYSRADAKGRIDERISKVRADQKQRIGKLEEAWKLTREALRP